MHTEETMVHANGIDIAYDTFGKRTDPPMVLIMGLSSQMIIWDDEFCERLAGRGYRVVRFDNRDVGRSSTLDILGRPDFKSFFTGSPLAALYTLDDMARDTLGLMDALGIGSAHIAGVSMGGMISQLLAIDHPSRVRTLTVIMSTTGNPLLPPPRPDAVKILYRPFPTERKAYIDYFMEMWKVLGGDVLPFEQERVEKLARLTFERGVNPTGSARQIAAIMASGSRKERLSSVTAPTLVIHGSEDPLLRVECGIDVAESIPGAALKIIPGMGHALSATVWDEIVDAMDMLARGYESGERRMARDSG
jgi:pimeloyl-ACP methyl ester carboxylesterase